MVLLFHGGGARPFGPLGGGGGGGGLPQDQGGSKDFHSFVKISAAAGIFSCILIHSKGRASRCNDILHSYVIENTPHHHLLLVGHRGRQLAPPCPQLRARRIIPWRDEFYR